MQVMTTSFDLTGMPLPSFKAWSWGPNRRQCNYSEAWRD